MSSPTPERMAEIRDLLRVLIDTEQARIRQGPSWHPEYAAIVVAEAERRAKLLAEGSALLAALDGLREDAERIATAIPKEDWHEDDGTALWWNEAVGEPPHVGSPLDTDWADYDADYTHFTRIPNPKFPRVPSGATADGK